MIETRLLLLLLLFLFARDVLQFRSAHYGMARTKEMSFFFLPALVLFADSFSGE